MKIFSKNEEFEVFGETNQFQINRQIKARQIKAIILST
jgi:hypothetical protein